MDYLRKTVKKGTRWIAQQLNDFSNGFIKPSHITFSSLLLHIPIFFSLIAGYDLLSAAMIIVFGLLDSVDGDLARIQSRVSVRGMLLDASTDRMKEALIFIALAYRFASAGNPAMVAAAVAALSGSMLVSYIKAKGETALGGSGMDVQKINRIFQGGLMRYEIRMAVLVLGLIVSRVDLAILFIAALAWLTAVYRLVVISNSIQE